jgi:hypothetical protein
MSEDILKGNDGYIAVERQSGSGTLWSDSANHGTIREQRPARTTAREQAITEIAQRIADAIERRMKS